MSQENVDFVADSLRRFGVTKKPTGLTAPDFVWAMDTFAGWPDELEYRGWEGFMAFFAKWTEPYDQWDLDVIEIRDAGGDHVVADLRQRGRLRGADSWVELRFGVVYTVVDGLVRRAQVYDTSGGALEAAGLGTQGASSQEPAG